MEFNSPGASDRIVRARTTKEHTTTSALSFLDPNSPHVDLPVTFPSHPQPNVMTNAGSKEFDLDPDSDDGTFQDDDRLAPATKKAPWPLRYFQEMVEGFAEMDNLSGTQSQRFEVAFPMAAYKKATWNKHWNLFKLANEDELDMYSTPSGLWRRFTADVRTRVVRQVENAEQKFISSLSKTTATTEASSRSKPNSPSISLNCDFDCSFCNGHFPISPSQELLRLREALDAAYKTRYNKESYTFISALVEHCARHKAEATYENQPNDHKWPSQVNFATLGRRVESLRPELERVVAYPFDNQFYRALKSQVDTEGFDKAFSRLGDFKGSRVASVG